MDQQVEWSREGNGRNFLGQMSSEDSSKMDWLPVDKTEGTPETVVEITVQTTHLSNKGFVLTCSPARHLLA